MIKKRKIEGTFIRVTTSELYLFEPSYANGWSIEKVIDHWFNNFPINSCHAARDGGRVGNSKKIIKIDIIDEKDLDKELGVKGGE